MRAKQKPFTLSRFCRPLNCVRWYSVCHEFPLHLLLSYFPNAIDISPDLSLRVGALFNSVIAKKDNFVHIIIVFGYSNDRIEKV